MDAMETRFRRMQQDIWQQELEANLPFHHLNFPIQFHTVFFKDILLNGF